MIQAGWYFRRVTMKVIIKDDGLVYRDDGSTIPLRSNVKFVNATCVDNEVEDVTEVTVEAAQ